MDLCLGIEVVPIELDRGSAGVANKVGCQLPDRKVGRVGLDAEGLRTHSVVRSIDPDVVRIGSRIEDAEFIVGIGRETLLMQGWRNPTTGKELHTIRAVQFQYHGVADLALKAEVLPLACVHTVVYRRVQFEYGHGNA